MWALFASPHPFRVQRAEPGNAAATVAFPGECKGEGGDAAEGTTVPLEMLDAVVARSWRYPPALLKIDVEGCGVAAVAVPAHQLTLAGTHRFEPLIFDGGRQLLQNRPLTVVGEFIPFRVRRALPDKDPYASFFDFFGPAFSVRLVNSKFFGLNASATTEQTLAEIRGWANAKQHNGGNVVLTAAAASGGGVS